ncbi:iron-siderophore ABC transporter substrate-binding protein [Pseudonocardia phyllosphaerae]|uniref:iron-siderophore ABC transporter substrate-binding protein n=1 Tax=Pseudonocardia phyllosphaerae TaxID=3390502 RepID=UPI0039784FC1
MGTLTPTRPVGPDSDLTRRRLLLGAGAVTAWGVLSGCATTGGTDPARPAAAPNRVEHLRGVTEVPADPQRVVTVGYSDQDAVLALGVRPVAVTDWYGDYPYAVWPWAQQALGDAKPTVLNKGQFTGTPDYRYEQIAALRPDLILGLYTSMSEDEYRKLSAIAPTVGPPKGYPEFAAPWEAVTRLAGQALGRTDAAEKAVAGVKDKVEATRRAHPEFAGRTALVAERFQPGASFVRSPGDPRSQLLTGLGFVVPDDIPALQGQNDGAPVSDEQMRLLDRDVLLWNIGSKPSNRAIIEKLPLYPLLNVVKAGRSIFVEDPLVSGAWTWGTVLSLPTVVDALAAKIAPTLAR